MEFVGNIARKTGDPSLLAVEATKTQLARRIGEASGLFYVPRVIKLDPQTGVLEFERLKGFRTLLELASRKDPRLSELFAEAGKALAVIHERLKLSCDMKYELPPEWIGPATENAFIHGDFTVGNVGFDESAHRLVILDWSAAPLLGRKPTFGSKYFDILWFISSMFCAAPAKKILRWGAAESMLDIFTRAYSESISGQKLDKFGQYSPEICRLHRKNMWYVTRRRSRLKIVPYALFQVLMYSRLHAFLHRYW